MCLYTHIHSGSEYLSRYSDSLRPGRSGDRVPLGARFSALVQNVLGPRKPPVESVTWLFPGNTAAGAWRWPPILSSAEVKEREELCLYSTSMPSWPILGKYVCICTHTHTHTHMYIYIYIYYFVFTDWSVKSSMIRVVAWGRGEVFEWYGRPAQQSWLGQQIWWRIEYCKWKIWFPALNKF